MTCLRRWGTYKVNSAFNESVCLLSCMVMFDRPKNSMLGPLPGVNQSRNYLRPFLCHRISFCPFSSSHLILAKKICINRFLCLLALTARWGVALQSEKSDLRFTLQCPQQLINIKEYDTMSNQDFVWQELPPAEARIGVVPRPGNSMDRNLIMRKNIVIRDF